ncbi:MAG: hypothetical protein JWN95_3449 [Frankiales bacterium]|nr:hypothetical protein [Frankiales bacterium]
MGRGTDDIVHQLCKWHDGQVRPLRHHLEDPVLITEARRSLDDDFNARRKKYLIMMLTRAVCIIGAASTFQISGWLAAAFVIAALILPWVAVLIANDRAPKEAVRFRRFLTPNRSQHELSASEPAGRTEDAAGPGATPGNADGHPAPAAAPDPDRKPTIIDL